MIRINLIVGRDGVASGGGLGTSVTAMASGVTNLTDLGTKVGLAFVPVVALLIYEEYEMHVAESLKIELEAKAEGLRKETEDLKPKIEAAKKLLEEKGRLQEQINTIKELSKERLFNIKALSALQVIIPKVVWLSNLKFEGSSVELKGRSGDDASIYDFVGKLEESIYFKDVQLGPTREEQSVDGITKTFELKCNLEAL